MQIPALRPTLVRPILLANLVGEILIVVTGGIVRLTGSGLGCPTWPECVPGSFIPVPHQEQGIHKYIEFGNRTLFGVVGILAVLALYAVWTQQPRRRPLVLIAVGILLQVPAQAVVGGITVLTDLNPYVVALHFLVSMVIVVLSTMLLVGYGTGGPPSGDGRRVLLVPALVARLGWVTAAVGVVVVCLGTIVTGSGPHSGDATRAARTGLDPRTISWVHADAVMLFIGLVVATLVAVLLTAESARAKAAWRTVLIVTLAQGLVGYVQYFTQLPEVLVALHMLGATLLLVALTSALMALRRNPV